MTTRWGILGPGRIAEKFADDLALVADAELVAVGSRSLDRARGFAERFGAGAAYGSYEELAGDPDVDVVYVASPHALHLDHVTTCLDGGKAVLVEKPVTLRARDAQTMFARARERGLFSMEAMWTACHPVVLALRAGLQAGEYGEVHHLHAELGFVVDSGPDDRLLDPALGAGALLDMGIYPLTMAHLLLGEAEQLVATATLADTGIDLDTSIAGRYPGGAQLTATCSMTSYSSRRAEIATSRGRIVLEDFHHPDHATFTPVAPGGTNDDSELRAPLRIEADQPLDGRGYTHEIREVQRCLDAGLLQSPLVPHDQTLTLMRQLDDVRAQVGIRYPGGLSPVEQARAAARPIAPA